VNYLKTGELLPIYENDPNDIKIVFNALQLIDAKKKALSNELCVIDVEDCGAAYRFLMALLATTPGTWRLTGTPRLLERPILPLVNFLNLQGANIKKTEQGWLIYGQQLQINDVEIETSETSQYASAVMMMREAESKKQKAEGRRQKAESGIQKVENPYIAMTEAVLKMQDLTPFLNLADWSAAVFWLANALLKPDAHYLLQHLHFDNLQGDAEIVSWFAQWGLSFTENEFGIEVKHTHCVEIPKQKIEVTHTPDIAMLLATLSVCYPFELTLSGLKKLNLKESNRLDIMINELSNFTTVVKKSEEQITIYKRTKKLPQSFHFNSYNDHRFVMAWSLFKNFGTVKIEDAACIKKSYPEFFLNH
jgi:3-phosphoshikimate 1-carboxyvinyltransferase